MEAEVVGAEVVGAEVVEGEVMDVRRVEGALGLLGCISF